MKNKTVINFLFISFLTLLSAGCFTSVTSKKAFPSKIDWFEPTAIYNSHTSNDVIIEGGCYKYYGQKTLVYAPAYLIIPAKVLLAAHSKSGGDVSFSDIQKLPPDVRYNLRLEKNLPAGFEKTADIPQGQSGIQVNKQSRINVVNLAKLPFAFVIDVVTFPLQLEISKSFKNLN